jgi:hypothetical protein
MGLVFMESGRKRRKNEILSHFGRFNDTEIDSQGDNL